MTRSLIELAVLDYEHWQPRDLDAARALLAADPALGRADIYAAAATGDVEAVRGFLDRDPALLDARGGPFGWEPLLYACYSRLAPDATLRVAKLLLERGANPNAHYLWHGNVPPFTAVTGAFGEGENGVNHPPHGKWRELARALLAAGANPNDGQTLYNRHFNADDEHLELLFAYGLNDPRLLVEELWSAAKRGRLARVKLLVAHGVDVTTAGWRDGVLPVVHAARLGHTEIVALLVAHGAVAPELTETEQFAAACMRGDRERAMALMEHIVALGEDGRGRLVHAAVDARSYAGMWLMVELGFELDHVIHTTPLAQAAWNGDLEMVKILVEAGASTTATDPHHGATALGFARHNQQIAVVQYLESLDRIASSGE